MTFRAEPVAVEAIGRWRDLYRHEMHCQIIHDSIHGRPGWAQEFLLSADGKGVGYGSVAVGGPWKPQPAIYEFFVIPGARGHLIDLFLAFAVVSGATRVETQSNDPLLTVMLHTFCREIEAESILFHDRLTTHLTVPGALFRAATLEDKMDLSNDQLKSHGVVEFDGQTAAKGGILFHYNRPYGDIYMEVAEPFRKRGLGSYLVQELKRVAYEFGNIPAARCNPKNIASRKTLQKAGFVPCGNILAGLLRSDIAG